MGCVWEDLIIELLRKEDGRQMTAQLNLHCQRMIFTRGRPPPTSMISDREQTGCGAQSHNREGKLLKLKGAPGGGGVSSCSGKVSFCVSV